MIQNYLDLILIIDHKDKGIILENYLLIIYLNRKTLLKQEIKIK